MGLGGRYMRDVRKEEMVEKIFNCIENKDKAQANELLKELWKSNQVTFGYAAWLQEKINNI